MSCKRCASGGLKVFGAELAIHFPGWQGLDKPHVLVFSDLMVCLKCGLAEFVLTGAQVEQLKCDPAQSCGRSDHSGEQPL